ncbi:RHS repeat domain-containing protein [Pseudomonas sp.]|uniref:RHS repeat domain-containing protein n=1 Tax=Pseudomonas sp. TaxID=306 RepID=UPI003C70CE7F
MTDSTAVHSNAFNFMSYLASGVDPRTGQYTFSVNLPGLNCNFLQGPLFEFPLFYSPLNTVDSGFGKGWTLRLSQFDPATDVVSLATGESFKVTGKPAGKPWAMKEQKLETFHFYAHGNRGYRIVHKSGAVEVLKPQGARNLAVPVEIYNAQGHGIRLYYEDFGGFPRLASVTQDDGEVVLQIKREGNALYATTFPNLEDAQARTAFTFHLGGDGQVERLILPTEEQASWRLRYEPVRDLMCIVEVQTPTGALEELRYEDEGHLFPGNARTSLPRVTHHLIHPGFEQPTIEKRYGYELDPTRPNKHNFLGNGLPVTWQDDGLDNLFRYVGTYAYGSVETWYVADEQGAAQPVRTITRAFDQFHLQTSVQTVQNDSVQRSSTVYNVQLDSDGNMIEFTQQPANMQLPTRSTEAWWRLSQSAVRREQSVLTRYDGFGNLLEQVDANGVKTLQQWYDASHQDGHDADPEGFARDLKQKTVVPAENGVGAASVLVSRYRYATLAALGNDGEAGVELAPCYALDSETLVEMLPADTERQWQEMTYEYETDPAERWTYARPRRKVQRMEGGDLTTRYAYSQQPNTASQTALLGNTVLEVQETLTGSLKGDDQHSPTRTIVSQHSIVLDEPLLTRDDNDVEIRYEYDALHRVTCETVAPGRPEQASRRYQYHLCAAAGEQASQVSYDVKSVATRSEFDGLNRVIAELREDVDALIDDSGDLHPTYRAAFNALGEQIAEEDIDWVDGKLLQLRTTYRHDDWGQRCCTVGPDRVHHYAYTDPVGVAEHDGVVTRAWDEVEAVASDGTRQWLKSGVTVTWLNLFDKVVRTERQDIEGDTISIQEDSYDGLGRHTREIIDTRVNQYHYDVFDRLLEHKLPYDHIVVRTYASHSADDLPTSIAVNGKTLGEQSFDGLGRMSTSTTGGRLQTYTYNGSQLRPETVTKPSGALVEYDYLPTLVDEPVSRTLAPSGTDRARQANAQDIYDYDRQNGRLLSCVAGDQTVERSYYSTGQVKEETRTYTAAAANGDDQTFTMKYGYSVKERLLSYQDVLGGVQTYGYDESGRLSWTTLGSTTADFTYDAFGRTHTITTKDGNQQLVTTLKYDEFDREISRTFDFGDSLTQSLTQVYNDIDNLVQRTLCEDSTVLRDEFFTYDLRNRLTLYQCKGEGGQPALQAPEDPWGNVIAQQAFILDELDNITLVTTTDAEGQIHRTRYSFDNPLDPAQLTGLVHYPAGRSALPPVSFTYDDNGNMTCDEVGRTLTYDGLNRLREVVDGQASHLYHYDAQDKLTGTSGPA